MLMQDERVMLVDFERAKVCERQALGAITGNRKRKQRSEDGKAVEAKDEFSREVQFALSSIARTIRLDRG